MELLFVLLLLVWIVSQLFPQRPSTAEPDSTRPGSFDRSPTSRGHENGDSLRDALREIEAQLGGPRRTSPEPEQHWESPDSGAQPPMSAGATPQRASDTPDNPTFRRSSSERSAKETARDHASTEHIPRPSSLGEKHPGPSGSKAPTVDERAPTTQPARTNIKKRLRHHSTRREMYLFKELIDPPRSQRPWPR